MTEQEKEDAVVAEMAAVIIKAAGGDPLITINRYYPRGDARVTDGFLFGLGIVGVLGLIVVLYEILEWVL